NHEALHWVFQKTERPLPFDDSGPTSGSSLADGQTNQLAAVAIGIHPLTDHQRTGTQAVAIDLHATDEVTIYLAQQVQVTFEVAHSHVTGEDFRSGQLATGQRIVAPQGGGGTLIHAFHCAIGQAHVDVAEALGDASVAGSFTLPEHTAAFQV